MPVVANTERDPAGNPHRNVPVRVRLVAALVGAAPGYVPADDYSIAGSWSTRTDNDGAWSVDLVSNEMIAPADTFYQADVSPKIGPAIRHEFSVPDGAGPYRVEDILTDPPANLPTNLSDLLAAEIADRIGGDAAEAAARAAEDIALGSAIASEVADRTAAVAAEAAARIADVNAEEARASAAESAEASARAAADTTLGTNLTAETAARIAADAAEVTNRVADVNAEEARALAAESTEASARAAADTTLTTNLSAETAARIAADAALANDVATGTTNLAAETAARIADVNAEENRALVAEAAVASNLATETAARVADVNAEETRALAAESVVAAAVTTEAARAAAAESVLAGDVAGLDADLGTIDTALATETAVRAAADSTLTTNLSAETAARIADVNAEENRALVAEAALAGDVAGASADIAAEITNRVADVNAEETRALAAESVLAGDVAAVTADLATLESELPDIYVQSAIVTETPSATVTLDLADGITRRYVALESDTTLAVDNDDAHPVFLVIVDAGDDGGFGVTFWDGIRWATEGGTAPVVTSDADARDVFSFIKLGSADYLGFVVGQGLAIPIPPEVPDIPVSIVAVAGNTTADVTFTPGDDNGAARDGCRITPYIAGVAQTPQVFATTATTQTVTGLTNGTAYTFKVEDHNAVGYSAISVASNSVTPDNITAPGAPTIGSASDGDNAESTVTWTSPASNGGSAITGYQVKTYNSSGTLLFTNTIGVVLTYTKTGLTNGVDVKFKVAAINAIDTGSQSAFTNVVTPTAAPFSDPSDVPDMEAWFVADSLSLADNAAVASWPDDSGNARHAVQADSAKQPIVKLVRTGFNGHDAVYWDGTDRWLTTPSFTLPQPLTIFSVSKLVDVVNGRTVYDGVNAFSCGFLSNSVGHFIYAGSSVGDSVPPTTATNIGVGVFNGASSKIRLNGGAGTAGDAGTASPGGFTLGTFVGGSQVYQGDIAEFIVYSRVLTLVEINDIGNYLATRYGLTWTTAT